MEYSEEIKIANLIVASLTGAITDAQQTELDYWLSENNDNRMLYNRISEKHDLLVSNDSDKENEYVEQAIRKIQARIAAGNVQHKETRIIPLQRFLHYAVAACLLVGLSISAFLLLNRQIEYTDLPEAARIASSKVKLITPDGKEISLGYDAPETIKAGSGAISRNNNGLFLTLDETKNTSTSSMDTVMHSIVTGIGGETLFVLSDNSKVWLNANSRLDFPVKFSKEKRKVILTGEAYFEIAPDKRRPFTVETNEMAIEVLGTSFNIKAYNDEPTVQTTLLTGKVSINVSDKTLELNPGLTAILDRKQEKVEVKQADIEAVMAWKSGYFIFHDEDLQTVVRTLARWYDVKFVTNDVVSNGHTFNGRLNKYLTLQEILERITLTGGPRFRLEGDQVFLE
ncbi:MAG: FecR domain-containing protein [Dysgonamonadaceae bacterium]|jgi:ferric-dicitrate binding protein FerR (iron transport regulator)|nr:FecR domain-containing protein [Dysgonamonadaceae bacterium]